MGEPWNLTWPQRRQFREAQAASKIAEAAGRGQWNIDSVDVMAGLSMSPPA